MKRYETLPTEKLIRKIIHGNWGRKLPYFQIVTAALVHVVMNCPRSYTLPNC
jgi:hypothetical protein